MSSADAPMTLTGTSHSESKSRFRRDTLATSVLFLIGLGAVQPLVSLLRGVIFCRTLAPAALGAWDMALGFLMLSGTVVVLGIPGSFGRYVEHYSQRGQLASFLRRTTLACLLLTGLSTVALVAAAPAFSELIFGSRAHVDWVYYVAMALPALIAFGFVVELLTAMRLFRVVSGLQLLKATSFVVLAVALFALWRAGLESVIVGHAIGSLLAVAVACYWIVGAKRETEDEVSRAQESSDRASTMWAKLMPFAVGIWLANMLTHLFEIIDRYMIIHFSGMPSEVALEQVGHYHSSRIVPLLFVSFAGLLGSMLLPHLAKDWESGKRTSVSDGVNFSIKVLGLGLTAAGAGLLLIAPFLFEFGFGGRYDGGLVVFPLTIAYCVWLGLCFMGDLYITCAERIRLISFALAIGLVSNVVLNLLLLPPYGLWGAVAATAGSKFLLLAVTVLFARKLGMRLHAGTLVAALLPLSLCLGATPAIAILAFAACVAIRTDVVLTADEKKLLARLPSQLLDRLRSRSSAV